MLASVSKVTCGGRWFEQQQCSDMNTMEGEDGL